MQDCTVFYFFNSAFMDNIDNWSTGRKLAFRFFMVYFSLYIISLFFSVLFVPVAILLGKMLHIAGPKVANTHNGSGDTTYHYMIVLSIWVLTPVITLIWTIADRRRANYVAHAYWLQVIVRYILMAYLLIYGFGKVFLMQFGPPSLAEMIQPFGYSSPMGLAWKFMGYSYGYSVFTGIAEITGGILLFFRKTRLAGALVSMAVMANVVAMNFFYDIPVKIFSTHLFLMAVFIASADRTRLAGFFLLNRPVPGATGFPAFDKEINTLRVVAKGLVLSVIALIVGFQFNRLGERLAAYEKKPPLYGIYEVEQLVKNNIPIPLLVTDTTLWRHIVIERKWAAIGNMNDDRMLYEVTVDTVKHLFKLNERDKKVSATLHYSVTDTNHLALKGMLLNDSVSIIIKRKKLSDYRLMITGFHWVNERPYNR
ncbi:MAG: hypothetical protein K0Q79_2208 [Flavipsychrobacter sp.]|jgi:hypothetical protein|nr:hypothetical protein [Flavipsychrobacter sp.]